MKTLVRATAVAAISVGVLSACGGAPQSSDSGSSSSEPTVSASPQMYSLTIVRREPDGHLTQTVKWFTEAQMIAQRDERLQAKAAWKAGEKLPLTSIDSSCSIDDVALWEGTNATGNELCLVSVGVFDLANDVSPSWWQKVRSYDGAVGDDNNGNCDGESGYFSYQDEDGTYYSCGEGFSCNGGLYNAGSCGQAARWVVLTN